MSRFRPDFHTFLATQMIDNVYYQRANYYYFLGRLNSWEEKTETIYENACDCLCPECVNKNGTPITVQRGDNASPYGDPDDAYMNDTDIRNNIVYLKKITANDVSLVCKTYEWKRDTVYTQWDNTKDMTNLSVLHPFYVVTSEFNVYKCLFNNHGAPSTVEPTGITYDIVKTEDGYIWKYMYNIPTVKRRKFYNSQYMPVQTALTDSFYSLGAIEEVTVVNGGSGYSSTILTTATVEAPTGENGRQAKLTLYVNKDTGSIDSVSIDDAGNGYLVAPKITVNDRTGRGTSKYSVGGTAQLKANVLNGKIDSVVIVDCGINYPADEDTVLAVSGDGEGCVLYPKIMNGEIVGVIVANQGFGYSYLNITAVSSSMLGQGATFRVRIGGSNLTSNQATVEQTAKRGAIYAIEVANGGDNYHADTTTIEIDGDGEGCYAEPIIENGVITAINVLSYGKNYTYAKISFVDTKRLEPNNYTDAEAYAILPPIDGHGFDAVKELYGNTMAIYVAVRDDNKLVNLNQDYRQFGLIVNPKGVDTKTMITTDEAIVTFKLSLLSATDLTADSIVMIDGVKHRIVSVEDNTVLVQQLSSNYHVINKYSTFSQTNETTGIEKYYEITGILEAPDVDKYTGSLMYSSNNTPFILTSGRTFGIRSYIRF